MHGQLADSRRGPRLPAPKRRKYGAAELRRGLDSQGRFIGSQDLERALKHFWNAPHRRAAAPLIRPGFDFGPGGGLGGPGGAGTPRPSRAGLTPDDFRRMHALHANGKTPTDLAAEFSVSRNTIYFHLNGRSASMRHALATAALPRR